MVYRVYVEKKEAHAFEARALLAELKTCLGLENLTGLRIINRYDAENITPELFAYAKATVFSEPQLDRVFDKLEPQAGYVFAAEYLPGQFDQRADSAAQCIQILSKGERPTVRTAKVYVLYGPLTAAQIEDIQKYVINPVESRQASLEEYATLTPDYPLPTAVEVLEGFRRLERPELENFIRDRGLAMDIDDILCCQAYFRGEDRDPTVTEIKVLDTYWSDHCRHTTFHTQIDRAEFEDALLQRTYEQYLATRRELGVQKPVCLMDMATVAVKHLKAQGRLDKLDESEEINACTVKIQVEVEGKPEPWLLLFKNETHNHPTEIEPFGGAATCIGGAIRDPLSGRAYVYAAMRLTGAADPLTPVSQTIPGKLPQRKIVTTAAAGYSSYGNQIGLATGLVDEVYHPGYAAKRMEVGAVIAAAPAENVRREAPMPGDVVVLLGGATGRDGIGGATGSSKAHNAQSVQVCGAEVQKGNAPEERKLQRLFRDPAVTKMIKRCNDFGAGGVSVAIGELAVGLDIDLDAVPKKYEGLDGTELAISESQERMAVVIEAENTEKFLALAAKENLQATVVARVQAEPRLIMRWQGRAIVDISRAFLDSNGAPKHIRVVAPKPQPYRQAVTGGFVENYKSLAQDLSACSRRGLAERFDATIGGGTVLMPFGGRHQLTPIQAMAHKLPAAHTDTCSFMAYGFDPAISQASPYHGAYLAVVSSVSKLIATGASFEDVYLSFQEYFPSLRKDPRRWGLPFAALLGAFRAQMELGIGAIGGKDSMSGSFESLDVPPTLISFAVTTGKVGDAVSPEFKQAGHKAVLLMPEFDENDLPKAESLMKIFDTVTQSLRTGKAVACYALGRGGVAEAAMKMAFGNGLGLTFEESLTAEALFGCGVGGFLLEATAEIPDGRVVGTLVGDGRFTQGAESLALADLQALWEGKLESVYHCNIQNREKRMENFAHAASAWPAPAVRNARPRVLIPVFPGTNCELDSAKAMADAGAEPEILVINNLSADGIARSVDAFAQALGQSQMVFLPGGFSGGDEPDGSGKFITAFFRNPEIRAGVEELLQRRDGLMCGICNGFQALVKLGLVPYGRIIDTDEHCPTLSFNTIGRHQSRIVRIRVASNLSPWLKNTRVGEVYSVPISHGEGRFIAEEALIRQLAANGQIATQYVDLADNATSDIRFNPNDSMYAIEGITSPDGRVFGKMGHAERIGGGLYKNVPGQYDIQMFRSAVEYFKG